MIWILLFSLMLWWRPYCTEVFKTHHHNLYCHGYYYMYLQILFMDVYLQPDNTSLGVVKVGGIEEARFAIAQFHRKKIGYKRIHVTLRTDSTTNTASTIRCVLLQVKEDFGSTNALDLTARFVQLIVEVCQSRGCVVPTKKINKSSERLKLRPLLWQMWESMLDETLHVSQRCPDSVLRLSQMILCIMTTYLSEHLKWRLVWQKAGTYVIENALTDGCWYVTSELLLTFVIWPDQHGNENGTKTEQKFKWLCFRSEAIALLSEAKDNVLPLFKFIELFNKRWEFWFCSTFDVNLFDNC